MKYTKFKILTRENWIDFDSPNIRVTTNKLRNVVNDTNIKTTEVYYMYKHNIYVKPLCSCGNELKFLNITNGYRKHCSNRCSKLDLKTQEKEIKQTPEELKKTKIDKLLSDFSLKVEQTLA